MSKEATTKETVIREMEGIIRSQHDLHGRIARSYDNLKKMGFTNITIGLVEARLQALEANWAKFEAQHDKLYASFWESLTEHDYEKRNVPATVEEAYLVQKGMFLETLCKLKSKLASEAPSAAPASQPSRTTLPRIQLPEFTGKYEAWPAFRDLFHSIIGKDGATTSVEKLHYLKSCLKDEAELLVRSLPTTDENFDRAWKTLADYYENKRLLVRSIVKRFWQQEELPGGVLALTPEDRECENFFSLTHSRTADGRYMVRLPVVDPLPDLKGTRSAALRALAHMERRFARDDKLKQLYVEFMRQYEKVGHMTPVAPEDKTKRRVSYLPHHGVMREASTSTKLRVVFNGSTSLPSGDSLNKCLRVGPNLLPNLADVLLRWRRWRYVLATDMEKMYRQILFHPDDCDLQRIFWRYKITDEIQEYLLNTVTYGLTCAPFLAMRSVQQLAEDEKKLFPLAAIALLIDRYMNDVLSGADTLEEAQALRRQLSELCMAGGFPLRKWSANEESLLTDVPAEHRMQRELRSWRPQESHATLGLQWHPCLDSFSFATKTSLVTSFTKRAVLSLTARLFDPLGWLAPVVVSAKILFQATWLRGLDWDDPLSETDALQWKTYQAELPLLEQIRVPRRIYPSARGLDVELHGFADASEKAYAAVVYLRAQAQDGSWLVTLLAAKTKVAPLKTVALPRLELDAAALLARLAAHTKVTLELPEAPLHLWSDAMVALGWIRGHPTRWKTYVANRHHVPGRDNPADCASRGISPGELGNHPLWWYGPPWLKEDSSAWPATGAVSETEELPEERVRVHAGVPVESPIEEPEELRRFSSLQRLLRVTAWCRRWLWGRGGPGVVPDRTTFPYGTELTSEEMEEARLSLIRLTQANHFSRDLTTLRQGCSRSLSNCLVKLNPFLDARGLLRVGGRIKHAVLPYDERHPVVLPGASHFTQLIVEACHRRHNARRSPNDVEHESAALLDPARPSPGETSDPPLRYLRALAGGNFATANGQSSPRESRGQRAYKAFISVFVCLVTRAVHLEVVSDYTAVAFLAALRRFTSRRGLCSSLHNDCGTNFVGADKQLRALFTASNPEGRQIAGQLASDGIKWRFNPPSAPHFGGLWEAAVKSLKHHLRRVLGETTLTYEEMSTLLAEIEACLNSRPLQAFSDNPDDLAVLTPGHFLVGSALIAVPEPSLLDVPVNRLTRWQLLQQMRDYFWKRWSQEYVHSLVHRPKWQNREPDVQLGRLCLLRNETTPPTRWPLARVVKVHPGEDGRVRVVTVRTATGELTRPIVKLVLLPASDGDPPEEA
ncbi:uncharacterized protein LOC143904736 [Temnothorax americanus]|uniref:uncharacterized protein LOC143904736 n=1 Tax=Temnothorax americanus TaxID=1964332 RepID=UPI0040695DCE